MQALKMQKYSVGKISLSNGLFFTHCHEHKCCVVIYVKGLLTVLFIVPLATVILRYLNRVGSGQELEQEKGLEPPTRSRCS